MHNVCPQVAENEIVDAAKVGTEKKNKLMEVDESLMNILFGKDNENLNKSNSHE